MTWVPVSRTKHRDKALSRNRNYLFAKSTTLVPVHFEDLFASVVHMPMVFYQRDDITEIVAVLGLEKGNNLFVGDDGSWPIDFVPAAFRCHPFSAVDLEDGDATIVYREGCDLVVDRNDGDPFFNADGTEGEVFKSLVSLAVAFKQQKVRTRAACSLLAEFELLKPLIPSFERDDGSVIRLGNLFGIDQIKFNALQDKKFRKLRETCAVDLVYAHLFSLSRFSVLLNLMRAREKTASNLSGLGLEIFADREEKMNFNF